MTDDAGGCVLAPPSSVAWRAGFGALLFGAGLNAGLVRAQAPAAPEDFQAYAQATFVRQYKSAFASAYDGPRSLRAEREGSYTFTSTAMLGWRAWRGGELYLNAEASQGAPLSGLSGLGGFTNGEATRASGSTLTLYRARAFLRQTWGLGGGTDAVEAEPNQLAGSAERRRLVLTAGNLSVLDLFDDNAYSHDPRTQFLNWALMTHGAYDYAADARGYSWGAAIEYFDGDWALRAGRFAQPREPNQLRLDPRIDRRYGDQIELERAHRLGGRAGKLRLLLYRNQALMSSYRDALAIAGAGPPDLNQVRIGLRAKRGVGLNLEQELLPGVGLFARAMWADGGTETYAFTEIDRSRAAGLLVQGARWGRAEDSIGLAIARNGLSGVHREYLARGGIGYFIGDGRLNYRAERVLEVFYRLVLSPHLAFTLDHQRIANPAYNADRGPVAVTSVRAQFTY